MIEGGKGSASPKKLLHAGGVWRTLSNVAQSAGKGGPTLTKFCSVLRGHLFSLVKGSP